MYTHTQIYMHMYVIYIYMCIHVFIYVHIYIYIERDTFIKGHGVTLYETCSDTLSSFCSSSSAGHAVIL